MFDTPSTSGRRRPSILRGMAIGRSSRKMPEALPAFSRAAQCMGGCGVLAAVSKRPKMPTPAAYLFGKYLDPRSMQDITAVVLSSLEVWAVQYFWGRGNTVRNTSGPSSFLFSGLDFLAVVLLPTMQILACIACNFRSNRMGMVSNFNPRHLSTRKIWSSS